MGFFLRPVTKLIIVIVGLILLFAPGSADADQVAVRYAQGATHGFLILKEAGKQIAEGELTQSVSGERVSSHLVFHFHDGSLYEDSVVYMQRKVFQLVSDRVVQKGPAFKTPMDATIQASGQITIRYTDEHGNEKTINDNRELPPDLANGIIPVLMANIRPDAGTTTVSLLAATPKPRVVTLIITPGGEDPFSVGRVARKAQRYEVKVDIKGIEGAVAPLVGKQPPNSYFWIFPDAVPAYLASEGPLAEGGPIWRIETVSAEWPEDKK